MENCPLCEIDSESHAKLWSAYGQRMNAQDIHKMFSKVSSDELTDELIKQHFFYHHFIQPAPFGSLDRGQALQEALTTFPGYYYYMLRALYRSRCMDQEQIFDLFYMNKSPDQEQNRKDMELELTRLSLRNFLYRAWPEDFPNVGFEHDGPFYFIGRQSIPLIERLEGMPSGDLSSQHYVTNFNNIESFITEIDLNLSDVIVGLRKGLYDVVYNYHNEPAQAYLEIEHWFSAPDLETTIEIKDRNIKFSPDALVGVRTETPTSSLSTILPLWIYYDRGVEDISTVSEQILLFDYYFRSEFFKKTFNRMAENKTPGMVLVVCDDPFRRDDLLEALSPIFQKASKTIPIYFTDHGTVINTPYIDGVIYSAQTEQTFNLLDKLFEHNQKIIRHRIFSSTDPLNVPALYSMMQNMPALPAAKKDEPKNQAFSRNKKSSEVEAKFDSWED